jgi:hypothetical protein
MSTAAIASTNHAPQTKIPLTSSQCAQDYATLQNALQAGDLAAARRAYNGFWEEVARQNGPIQLFVPNAQTGYDLQAVGSSLNSANIPGARRAFAMFQKDMLGAEPNTPRQILHARRPTLTSPSTMAGVMSFT